MKLFYREFGVGEPLIILHGLYGSSDNWVSIAKSLETHFRVIVVDQRNHGQSPHSHEHSYNALTNDLLELFDDLKIDKGILLGHSMGGKVAMQFTLGYPEKVSSLIVVDIAPWGYANEKESTTKINDEHQKILEGLLSIPINNLSSRDQADAILSEWVKSERVRQFLLKNLKREPKGSFSWKLNLSAISSSIANIMSGVERESRIFSCKTKTLFIKGELSDYIPDNREEYLKSFFPESKLVTIEKSGHWVHAEKPNEFLSAVLEFLNHEH